MITGWRPFKHIEVYVITVQYLEFEVCKAVRKLTEEHEHLKSENMDMFGSKILALSPRSFATLRL